jgi:hypothetical protein
LYYLTILSGELEGQSIKLEEGETSIGRSSKCAIKLTEDTDVSREHVKLTMKQGTVMAEDCGSTHGTRLNESEMHGTVSLTLGDVLQVGRTLMRLDLPTVGGGAVEAVTIPESIGGGQSATHAPDYAGDSPVSVGEGPATQFDSQVVHLLEEEMGGATRVFQEDATRMMDENEMREVRPGQAAKPTRVRPILGIALMLFIVVLALAIFGGRKDADLTPRFHRYTNAEFGFGFNYPDHWPGTDGEGAVRAVLKIPEAKGVVRVIADRDEAYRFALQPEAVKAFVKAQTAERPGFFIALEQDYRARNADAVTYYTFRTDTEQGAGYFFLDGDQQIVVEGSAPKASWSAVSIQVDAMLESLALNAPQRRLVHPLPDAKLKALALVNPDAVRAEASASLAHGDELIKNRDVAYGNLFYGVRRYENCLTACAALPVRPPMYKQAALKLIKARDDLRAMLAMQDTLIIQAYHISDYTTLCNESQIMLQMVPDPMHPDYQRAMGVITDVCQ